MAARHCRHPDRRGRDLGPVLGAKEAAPAVVLSSRTLEDQLTLLPATGTEAMLLIGPPRTRKDASVRDEIEKRTTESNKPLDRIRLLDLELSEQAVQAETTRIDAAVTGRRVLGSDGRVWLHVANLESQLVTADTRKFVLKLLDKLLDRSGTPADRVLIVTTSVDPIANFQEVFDDERQGTY